VEGPGDRWGHCLAQPAQQTGYRSVLYWISWTPRGPCVPLSGPRATGTPTTKKGGRDACSTPDGRGACQAPDRPSDLGNRASRQVSAPEFSAARGAALLGSPFRSQALQVIGLVVDVVHRSGDGGVTGLFRDEAVHLLGNLAVGGMTLR
jgi:hypothetical protein